MRGWEEGDEWRIITHMDFVKEWEKREREDFDFSLSLAFTGMLFFHLGCRNFFFRCYGWEKDDGRGVWITWESVGSNFSTDDPLLNFKVQSHFQSLTSSSFMLASASLSVWFYPLLSSASNQFAWHCNHWKPRQPASASVHKHNILSAISQCQPGRSTSDCLLWFRSVWVCCCVISHVVKRGRRK